MSQAQGPSNRKKFSWIPISLAGLALVVVFTAGGLAFAARYEDENSFCGSCHTQPEVTYLLRLAAPKPVDLASVHPKVAGCIGCHSGKGTIGRVKAEFIGARNAARWLLGIAAQPAVLTFPIRDENCLECHQLLVQPGFSPQENITIPAEVLSNGREGKANHWHTDLAHWQAAASGGGGCVSCHSGHTTGGTSQNGFMNPQKVKDTCDACHRSLNVAGP